MALTSSMVTIAQTIQTLLANSTPLGLKAVYYGDQNRIASTPVACVEPVIKENQLRQRAAARMLDLEIETTIMIYHSRVQSGQISKVEIDQYAEAVELFLNQQRTLGGIVIHFYISRVESGQVQKPDGIMQATRLVGMSKSQNLLPS